MFKIYQVCKGKDEGFAHALDLPVLHTFFDGLNSTINKQKIFGSEIKRCGGFLDSGAFSLKNNRLSEDDYQKYLSNYISFINSDLNNYEIVAQLDETTYGIHTPEMVRKSFKATMGNYKYMLETVKNVDNLCIVHHVRKETLQDLHDLLHFNINGKRAGIIALAMAYHDTIERKIKILQPIFNVILNSPFADSRIHCLGLTIPQLLSKYPFTSSDSTSVLMAAAYGQIFYWIPEKDYYVRLYVGRLAKTEKKKSYLQMPKKQFNEFSAYVKDFGFTVEELSIDRDAKVKFNYAVMKRWCEQYKCDYKKIYNKKLF